jgi:hypothetical protein
MSFFAALLARLSGPGRRADPGPSFSSRGEGITYRAGAKEIEIAFSDAGGPSILTDTIRRWKDGGALSGEEKSVLLGTVLVFLQRQFPRKPKLVINTDDPSRGEWERLAAAHAASIAKVEYTSDRELAGIFSDRFGEIPSGKEEIIIDGAKITDPDMVQKAIVELLRKRRE